MAVVTMRQLLDSGVHFGHQTRRWNPKMKRFILTERNGIYIIDLQQSIEGINTAYDFVKEIVARGGNILFVGTKKQAQAAVAEQAQRVGMPYVNQRWLGGMLTNFSTVRARLDRMKELEQIDFDDVAGSGRTKKELLMMRREKDKLQRTLGGIRDMSKLPAAVWVVDTKKEHLAISEAQKLGIPVIAILDTNCDPDEATYGIPGNDDAIRAVTLLTRVVADATAEGLAQLVLLTLEVQQFLLGQAAAGGVRQIHALEFLETLDPFGDGVEVGEHATQPALVDVGHADTLGLLGHGGLGLLLGPDEQDVAAASDDLLDEVVGGVDALDGLLEVDDVDAVALGEDEALHLGVPATGLVPEVDTAIKELAHGDDGHDGPSVCAERLLDARSFRGTAKQCARARPGVFLWVVPL